MTERPSKSSIRKAGSKIRAWDRGEITTEEATPWFDVILRYRRQFPVPMTKVNMGLRSMLQSQKISGRVTQRLKRFPTIINKLTEYESGLDLSRMHDIGGCRLVVQELRDVYRAQDWVQRNWELSRPPIDYIAEPRSSGYRSLHLIVLRDGVPIEVQVRTQRMHEWAQTVEAFSHDFQINFKNDAGDSLVQDLMRLVSRADEAEEIGSPAEEGLLLEARELARSIRLWYQEGREGES